MKCKKYLLISLAALLCSGIAYAGYDGYSSPTWSYTWVSSQQGRNSQPQYYEEKVDCIKPLTPGDPDKVLGNYPGMPDRDGFITFHVVGKGVAPESATNKGEASLLAERSAINDGYRKLAEKIHGVKIYQWQEMENESVDFDFVRTEMETWLRGVEVLKIKEGENGIVEAYMRARIYASPDHVIYKQRPPQPQPPPQYYYQNPNQNQNPNPYYQQSYSPPYQPYQQPCSQYPRPPQRQW
ncbi:MAG: hypothetical protein HQK76_11150 [Desulfobacterales bacterium]|nr:hypothetical protein [Desulfobacterales bacterium]